MRGNFRERDVAFVVCYCMGLL